jgi:uncharacterized protein YbaR (Trm112 family)
VNDLPEGLAEGVAGAETPASVPLDRRLLEILVCPVTRGPLIYDAERQELVSKGANRAYPIHNGIPVMLVDEARVLED